MTNEQKNKPWLLFILTLSTIANSLGLYLLHKDGVRQSKQILILKFLSGCEIVISVLSILRWVLILRGSSESDRRLQIVVLLVYAAYINYDFVMIIMTLDRFIGTKYPFKYSSIASRGKARIILVSSAIISGVLGFVSFFLDYKRFHYFSNLYVYPIISAIATVCIILTYAYILRRIILNRRLRASQEDIPIQRNRPNDGERLLKMAAVITATFMLCSLIPDILFALFYKTFANLDANIFFITWYLGLLLDPITYVFMQKQLRELLFEMFYVQKCRRNIISPKDDTVPQIFVTDTAEVDTKHIM